MATTDPDHFPLLPMYIEEKPKQPSLSYPSTRNKADILVDHVLEHDFDLIYMSDGLSAVRKVGRTGEII